MPNPYSNQSIAVFGVSQDTSKYGYKIFHTLLQKRFTVFGINPKGGSVEGHSLYSKLSDVPHAVDVAVLVIPPAAALEAVSQCKQKGVKEIWFQPGAQEDQAFVLATASGIKAVNACFMAENGLW
ncbi:MAG: CoA-binding protein [Elusimicrobiaceae bacterium]|nr:CoA-binding protein [Elusimicrobiaceae bacterium]MBP5617145.1 CoA-binding protein [Elusimicrobiaceae bacterium]